MVLGPFRTAILYELLVLDILWLLIVACKEAKIESRTYTDPVPTQGVRVFEQLRQDADTRRRRLVTRGSGAQSQRVNLDCQYGTRIQKPKLPCMVFGTSFHIGNLNGPMGKGLDIFDP